MLRLQPMNAHDYRQFLAYAIPNYAEEKVEAGNYALEDALNLADQEYQKLLPQGLDTHDNYLLSIIETASEQKVGFIWLAIQQTGVLRTLSVVNILIYEEFRRRGYASQTFRLVEEKARMLGLSRVTLQVFGHNTDAQRLYERLGYRATNIYMAREIDLQTNKSETLEYQTVH